MNINFAPMCKSVFNQSVTYHTGYAPMDTPRERLCYMLLVLSI